MNTPLQPLELYPYTPGHQGGDTSREAAESMEKSAPRLRRICFNALRDNGPSTPDELAARLGLSILSVRPRVTELAKAGRIYDTGERRKNASGRFARVWAAA